MYFVFIKFAAFGSVLFVIGFPGPRHLGVLLGQRCGGSLVVLTLVVCLFIVFLFDGYYFTVFTCLLFAASFGS